MNLPTVYQQFIHKSRYARWNNEEERRETWDETVDRYFTFMCEHLENKHAYKIPVKLHKELKDAVLNLEVMPSMRALMTAGPALRRDNVCGYNCSYLPIEDARAFDETLYILMCGTGVGFSVERRYVDKLPIVNEHFENSDTTIIVGDSKAGWARALRELVAMLYAGQIPKWDISKLRPAGARLKTFGGRSSGPEPLDSLFRYTVGLFQRASGRKLTSLECSDFICEIAQVVLVGGVRRSALICLCDLEDTLMRHAKSGEWYLTHPTRRLANISAVYNGKPDIGLFMEEWHALYMSKSGERGIFNRQASTNQAIKHSRILSHLPFSVSTPEYGTNPCGEIILRPYQFCNLTEAVIRGNDTAEDIERKIRLATILGTFQATLTSFKYLRKVWTRNTEEERLLGVSMTGIMDHPKLSKSAGLSKWLEDLNTLVKTINIEFADTLKIPHSASGTCVKPSGTVSQLVLSASGMHDRDSPHYIRTVRGDNMDSLTKFLKESGVPNEPCINSPDSTTVFSFPIKSPKNAVFKNDRTAIEHLELWHVYRNNWCTHNPSVTISVAENEWMEVGAWVYKHFDEIGGISFLPKSDHIYKQAPYQAITTKEYGELVAAMPDVDWAKLEEFEKEDNTIGSQELACHGDTCEIVDIG